MRLPSVYKLKPAFQARLRPAVAYLAGRGITANQVTLAAVALSCLQGYWLYQRPASALALLALPVVLFVRMALNAIDGMLAREHQQKSRLGGFLNEIGDVVSDAVLYLPLAAHPAIGLNGMICFVLLAILTEFTGVLAASICGERRYDGPMGKSDRALLWGTVGFLAGIGIALAGWINWVVGIANLLMLVTMANRMRKALNNPQF